MLRLASDADVNGHIIRGLLRRIPELDLLRLQDELPEGAPDPEVLEWAAADGSTAPRAGSRSCAP